MSEIAIREVQIGPWLSQVFNHFSAHWQKYLVPSLAFAGVILAISIIAGVMFGVSIAVANAVNEDIVAIAMFGGSSLVVGALAMAIFPVFIVGYLRGINAVNRGEEFPISIITGTLRDLPTILGLMFLNVLAVWIGSMFCIIPGIVLGVGLQFALPIYADRKLGIVECLQESWELAKANLLMLFVYFFVAGMIVGVISYIPLVGMLAALPLNLLMTTAAYRGLTGQAELRV